MESASRIFFFYPQSQSSQLETSTFLFKQPADHQRMEQLITTVLPPPKQRLISVLIKPLKAVLPKKETGPSHLQAKDQSPYQSSRSNCPSSHAKQDSLYQNWLKETGLVHCRPQPQAGRNVGIATRGMDSLLGFCLDSAGVQKG